VIAAVSSAPVRIVSLELTALDRLHPARVPAGDVRAVRATLPSPELNRFFYTAVGSEYYWRDRLGWSFERWRELVAHPAYETWYLTVEGTPAGYGELDARRAPDVELACFGLLPSFIGQGFGGWLLEQVTRRGFELGRRVWLHTCSLDGPSALPGYLRRGFRQFKVEEQTMDLPAEPPAPWPGAARPRGGR
jgi:GNAT superfamily N-acetyltransferase